MQHHEWLKTQTLTDTFGDENQMKKKLSIWPHMALYVANSSFPRRAASSFFKTAIIAFKRKITLFEVNKPDRFSSFPLPNISWTTWRIRVLFLLNLDEFSIFLTTLSQSIHSSSDRWSVVDDLLIEFEVNLFNSTIRFNLHRLWILQRARPSRPEPNSLSNSLSTNLLQRSNLQRRSQFNQIISESGQLLPFNALINGLPSSNLPSNVTNTIRWPITDHQAKRSAADPHSNHQICTKHRKFFYVFEPDSMNRQQCGKAIFKPSLWNFVMDFYSPDEKSQSGVRKATEATEREILEPFFFSSVGARPSRVSWKASCHRHGTVKNTQILFEYYLAPQFCSAVT